MRRLISIALTVCFGVGLALVLLEAFVRVAGSTDVDGQFTFMGHPLHPYVLPVNRMSERIEDYLEVKEWAAVVYDENLGWTFKPDTVRQSGIFTVNSAGIRSRREYTPAPPEDTLRIALFGDSFTAGEDVNDDETWGQRLEVHLNDAGIRAEVLNFGVSGYGMGQAYLRWKHQGKDFQPDIVIFGLQPENLKRNVNVFRQLLDLSPVALPFSKPRFVFTDQALELVNSPTLPPEQLIGVFDSFASHPLAPYEFHYRSRDVVSTWWASSRLASFLFALQTQNIESPGIYEEGTEPAQLGKAIVDAFAADAQAQNSVFVVLHLPLQSHLIRYYSNLPPPQPPYQYLLDHFSESYHYITTEERIGPDRLDDVYWSGTKHYGPEIHRIVAEVVAEEITACVKSGACSLSRLGDTFSAVGGS